MKQPRVPEYRETDGVKAYMKPLTLFLKDFSMAAWTANGRRKKEIEAVRQSIPEMPEIKYPVTSVNGKTGGVVLGAQDVGALGREETAKDADKFGGMDAEEWAMRTLPAGGSAGQRLTKRTDEAYDVHWEEDKGMRIKLLWQNASPASAFASQKITMDLSAYCAVLIQFAFHSSTQNNAWWEPCPVGEMGEASYALLAANGVYAVEVWRHFVVEANAVTFGTGGYNQGNSNNVNDNSRAIPLKLYGIRGVKE